MIEAESLHSIDPLFDYLDCGGGKERVDDKIRENTHLYLADSNCHGVFLAICNDNGYVRMLERYNDNPIPSAKIVLLTNGNITAEMAKLWYAALVIDEEIMSGKLLTNLTAFQKFNSTVYSMRSTQRK